MLEAWRVDAELNGGHTWVQIVGLVSEQQDIADAQAQRAMPVGVILADCQPKWLTRLNRLLGR